MFNTSAGGASLLAQRSQINLLPASSLLLPSPGRPHQPPRWSPGCRPCPARLLHGAVLQSELLKVPSVLSLPCPASTVLRIKPNLPTCLRASCHLNLAPRHPSSPGYSEGGPWTSSLGGRGAVRKAESQLLPGPAGSEPALPQVRCTFESGKSCSGPPHAHLGLQPHRPSPLALSRLSLKCHHHAEALQTTRLQVMTMRLSV